jgi:hypothetical protein
MLPNQITDRPAYGAPAPASPLKKAATPPKPAPTATPVPGGLLGGVQTMQPTGSSAPAGAPATRLAGVPATPPAYPPLPTAQAPGTTGSVDAALTNVLSSPDRSALAGQTYDQLVARGQPAYEQGLRNIGKRAAALGRIGAGMTTNELTDYGLAHERDLDLSRRELSTQSAQQSIADRLAQLDATRGVRGDRVGEAVTQDQLFGNQFSRAATAYQLGTQGNPYGAYQDAATGYGQQAAGSMGALGDLVSSYAYNRARNRQPATAATPPTLSATPVRDILGGG